MRRLWHRIAGHRWQTRCWLCDTLRYHAIPGLHEPYLACRCGATKVTPELLAQTTTEAMRAAR